MKYILSPVGREFAIYMAVGMAVVIVLSMLDEILHLLRTRNYMIVHHREIKDVDTPTTEDTIINAEPTDGSKVRASNGRFTKRKDGDLPISDAATE